MTTLQVAAEYFKNARVNVFEGMRLLHQIYAEELWKGSYDSFREYVLEACDIKYAFAMRLVGNWNRYVIEGKIAPEKLKGVDVDRLYLAARLPGNAEKQLSKALSLSRSELQLDAMEERAGEHDHVWIRIQFCEKCGIRERI